MFNLLENNDIYTTFLEDNETFYVMKNYEYSDYGTDLYSYTICNENGNRLNNGDYSYELNIGKEKIKNGEFKTGKGIGSIFRDEFTSEETQKVAKRMLDTISEG